jgi:hypothetical protein
MRRSHTALLERNALLRGEFTTEPYEAGWASEARWFVRALALSAGATLDIVPEISPDGLHWCEEGGPAAAVREPGLRSGTLRNFGQWIRLRCRASGEVRIHAYLVLKE